MKGNSILWAIILVVAIALAIWSGWWVIAVAAKIAIYVALAVIAIGAAVMLVRKMERGNHGPSNMSKV